MRTLSLSDRIKKSRKEIADYPSWVVENSVFQGGACSPYNTKEERVDVEERETNEQSGKKKMSGFITVD